MSPEMSSAAKQAVSYAVDQLGMMGALDEATIVLIGSACRDTMTSRSDVDLLVVTPSAIPRMKVPVTMHVHLDTRESLVAGLLGGDDFRGWALRFGQVVHDPTGWWQRAVSDGTLCRWPDWHAKLAHAEKRVRVGQMAIEDGNLAAANEEYLMALSHVARALLLRNRVYPLTRPELPVQLAESGYEDVSELLTAFIQGIDDWNVMNECVEVVSGIVARLRMLPETRHPSEQWSSVVRDDLCRCK